MRPGYLLTGAALLPFAWAAAAAGTMTGHMVGHMMVVAVAAPLIARGVGGTRFDPAWRWPGAVNPLAMMLVELVVVWTWHAPTLRALVHGSAAALVAEQAMFLAAGLLLWTAALGAGTDRRAAGVGALLLTSMHMTLLGALIGLAQRPLYTSTAHGPDPLGDQQLAGVAMLMIGGASYLLGGLALLGGLLREERA